jgi:ABC-2 type transport system ATP-binding protein
MEEAERLCDRVAIIDQGEIKAEGTRRELIRMVGGRDRVRIEAGGALEAAAEALRLVGSVVEVSVADHGIDLIADDASVSLSTMLSRASEAGAVITSVDVTEPNLEAVFLHLTGKALRD